MTDIVFRLPPWRRAGPVLLSLSPQERGWALRQFKIPRIWAHTRGAGVRIAVLDTGIDKDHVDLAGQVVALRDFTRSRYEVFDVQGHGTHCAGIIAARENDRGIVGLCPDLGMHDGGLIVGKVLADDGAGEADWVADGIAWAVSEGADVISMSLGSATPVDTVHDAICRAVAAGTAVITAAGNDGDGGDLQDRVNYPARYPETIAVGAVGTDRLITEFSSRGPGVDIAAPGENILSSVPGNRWVRMSGTSMATPFVAAVVGLARSKGQIRSVDELRKLLRENAEDAGPPGHDHSYGAGLIRPGDFFDAVQGTSPCDPQPGILVWIPGGEIRTVEPTRV